MKTQTVFFNVSTRGKDLYDITSEMQRAVDGVGIREGMATVFVCHTSASLVIFENADPSAKHDLLGFFERLVPENGEGYTHTLEGADDMTSHIRMALTRTSEVVPVHNGRLVLGVWQGVFVFEHRRHPHSRQLAVNVTGH